MNLEQKHIKDLLDKYFQGLTSIDEENSLKSYFELPSVNTEFLPYKPFFEGLRSKAEEKSIMSIPDSLLDNFIQRVESKKKSIRMNYQLYKITSIAAGAAILVICFLFVFKQHRESKLKDTYNNPQIAYNQVKQTLLYLSIHLNKSTLPLKNVSKMNEGISHLSIFSSFGSGLKELNLISRYYKEPGTENNKK